MNMPIKYRTFWRDLVRNMSPAFALVLVFTLTACANTGVRDPEPSALEADQLSDGSLDAASMLARADRDAAEAAAAAQAPAGAEAPVIPVQETPVARTDDEPLVVEATRAKVDVGTGKFINESAATRRDDIATTTGEVVFNFEAESLQAVVKAILGDLLQENYVIAPGLSGQVTFATAKPISSDQAMSVLEMLLAWNNATLVYKDGRYTVLPVAQAIPGNLVPRTGPLADARGYEVRVVPLRYISATAMQELLTPYARQGAILKADNTRSMIVLAGSRSDLGNYLQTIETFDVDWLSGMSVGVYPLERVEAATVVPELEKIFGDGGPTPLAGLFRFMPIERINAVLVITPQSEYLGRAEEWIRRLDRGGSESGAQLFVYYVKNVKATDLSEQLTDVFGGSSGGGSARQSASRPTGVGGVVPGVESVEIKSINSNAARQEAKAAAAPARPAAAGGDGIAVVSSDNIRITAIEESNALMIRASPGEYDSILGAIKRLDIVPQQVHIEAKILQVDLSNSLSFGVRWFFENATDSTSPGNLPYRQVRRNQNSVRQAAGQPLRNVWKSFAGSASSGGLAWTFLNTEVEAMIDTLQTNTNVRVLSAPSLVVLNNKEAEIQVGQQIPVVSSVYNPGGVIGNDPNNPGGGGFGNQSLTQFRDTGIMLSVKPRVNPGGLVYMEISQEESTPVPNSANSTGNVSVNRRTIQTEIAVQSGQTVMLGGLIKESETKSKEGIPGLSRIPIIGGLFGSTSNDVSRQELLVLITPTVIDSAEAARTVTDEYKTRFKGLKPLLKKLDTAE